MTHDERAVLAANQAFYEALSARDPEAMEDLWAHGAPVACVHPGWAPLRGREVVLHSWRALFRGAQPPLVTVVEPRAAVLGNVAYVVCLERLADDLGDEAGTFVATNVFVREGEDWRIVHHQSGPLDSPSEDEEEDEPPVPDRSLN